MKRIHKTIASWCLGVLCAISVAFGFAAIPALDANAAETSVVANVQMEEGASVRIGDAAIRFQTYVRKSYVDGLVNPEIGVYVIPQDLLGNGEALTNNTNGAKKILIDKDVWYKETDTHYVYNAVLYDIEANSYGRQIVARGYVKNGNSYTWADNTQVRSLGYVASAALNDGVDYKGAAFDDSAITCLEGYVDGALNGFAFTKDSYTLTVGQNQILETSITSRYLVDYVDNYVVQYTSDNAAVATVEDGKLVAKSAGIATITATLGSKTDTLLVQVNAEHQDIIMSNATIGMDFSIPASYTVTDITCAEESWGTSLSALTVSDTLKSDLSKHGANVMRITLSNGTTLQIPVTLVTGKISSLAEWQSAIQPTAEGDVKYGYYILANDISVATNSISVLTANMTATPDGADGFRGTLDGRGYAFTNTAAWWKFGLFGEIGSGAVIKNITINNTGLAATSNERYILAIVAVGATFENITFNLDNLQNTNALYGALSYNGFRDCTFTDVTINITGTITSLLGGANNITYWGLNGAGYMCEFTNCNVVLMTADSSLGELGHRGDPTAAIGESTHIKYVASNMSTANGETPIEGVTLHTLQETAVTLDTQEIIMTEASHSLDLGQYASYKVQSIMYNGTTDLGTNPSSVVINETDKSKHGDGNYITVVASSLTEKATITIPVRLVTKVITTVDELKALMPTGANAVTYGYYVLGNDIGDSNTLFDAGGRWFDAGVSALDGASYGFKATLDGRGHEIIFKISDADNQTSRYGMFGFIGTGAIIKDVTLTNESVRTAWGTYMLAKSIDGATFENVIFKLNNVQHRYENYGVFAQEIVNTTFRNVDIISKATNNIYGYVNVLFTDSGESGNGIFSGNTFENTNVYLYPGASYSGIAKNGTTVYTAEGLEVTGATILEGITVQAPVPEQVALTTRQELYLDATSHPIDIGEYSAYTVQSITLGENDLGTDLANLDLSSIESNTQLHGEQDIIVTLDKGNMGTALTVPVTIVTKIITTADEFKALMPASVSGVTYGYYVLGNDIGDSETIIEGDGKSSSTDRNLSTVSPDLGFRGTIDGRGYTFTFSFAVTDIDTGTMDQDGVFRFMGTGATVKDITFVCENIRTDVGTHFLGQNVQGATFENVTVVFNKVYSRYGAGLMAPSITNSTFANVDIVIRNMEIKWDVTIVFAGAVNALDGVSAFSGNTFTNTKVHLFEGASIASLATDGTNTYKELDGVSVINVTEKEVTLGSTQELVLSNETVSLNLGNYRDYEITSITYGTYDLGTDAKALTISEELKADKQNHGENKTIVVKAEKYADLVSINVPVTLITAKISTESEWISTFMTNTATTVTYGHYVLANDIKFTKHYQDTTRMDSTTTGDYGFRGTLDGRGYGVEITAWTYNGLFGELGAGAKIQDVTFTANGLAIRYNGHVLGRVAVSADFTDVTFNLTNLNNSGSAENGALSLDGFRSCTFTNVEFNVTGTVDSIFGGNTSQYWGLNGGNATCTFTNCYVNLMTEESGITELGHKGNVANASTTQYVRYLPTGMAAENGETVLGGITLRDLSGKVWVLNNNASPFTIVKPASADVYTNKAVSELQTFFKEATGFTLPVSSDTGLVHDENATYISLGETALKSSADLRVEELEDDGFHIETKDNTIYVVGGGTKGVLHGVYKLLNEWFGFEVYYKDCYTLNAQTQIAFEELDITDNPDIAMRSATGLTVNTSDNNYIYADRLQASDSYWAYMLPVVFNENGNADSGHNSLLYLPKSDYYSSYPEFYSNNSDWTDNGWGVQAQLCYTARGNATYSKMVEICADKIIAALGKYSPTSYPNYNNVMIGIQDNYNTCTCSACTAIINQYGAVSATIILFLDDVADAVEAWMVENPTYARDLQYMFFAYQETLKTPTTWPTVSNKIAPFVAMSEMNHSKTVTDTTTNSLNSGLSDTASINTNAKVLTQLQNWGAWATQNGGGAWAWTYGNFFRDYFCFYDSYDFYQGIMAKLAEYGYDLVYIQQQSKQSGAQSAFISMNIYVATQLAWDSTLDMDTLISNYMTAMYADAADEMLAIFNQSRTLFDNESMGSLSLGYETPGKELTKAEVANLFSMFDEAYAAIAHYETTNPALYTKLKQHIDMEWLMPAKIALIDLTTRYTILGKTYISSKFSQNGYKYDDIAEKFKTVVAELGITAGAELGTYADINNLLNAL